MTTLNDTTFKTLGDMGFMGTLNDRMFAFFSDFTPLFRRKVASAPVATNSPGTMGDWFYSNEEILFVCISTNRWRMISLTTW